MINNPEKRVLTNYHVDSRRERLTDADGYDFAFIPESEQPDTAAWRYDKHLKRHNIVMNVGVDKIMERHRHKKRARSGFLQRVYDHEGAHSLFCERDFERLGKEVKKWKVPFRLFNLFADGRDEACWRRKFKRRFNWLRWLMLSEDMPLVAVPGKPIDATSLFLDCVHMENSYKATEEWIKRDKDPKIAYEGKSAAKYGRRWMVRWYYRKAVHARTSLGLFRWVASWVKTFPETAKECITICIGIHGGDMPDPGDVGTGKDPMPDGKMPTFAIDADGSKHKENKETTKRKVPGVTGGTIVVSEDRTEGAKRSEEKDEDYFYKGESTKLRIPHNHYFNDRKQRRIDTKRADGLIRLFEKYLEGGEGLIRSRNPSGKIDMQQYLRGAEAFYVRKGEDPHGVKEISFIIDCSGSMSRAIDDGCYLAYVLNELVRKRKIECKKMLISGGDCYPVSMPFDYRILEHLQAPGSIEGFASTMREHEKDLVQSKLVIFYTDGNITDEHISKTYWHTRGVFSIGLFVGDPSRSESLHRWFDAVLVRNDIESIADSLIQLVKRQ